MVQNPVSIWINSVFVWTNWIFHFLMPHCADNRGQTNKEKGASTQSLQACLPQDHTCTHPWATHKALSDDRDRSWVVYSLSSHRPGAFLGGPRCQRHPGHVRGSHPHLLPVTGLFSGAAASVHLSTAQHEQAAAVRFWPHPVRKAEWQKGHPWASRHSGSGTIDAFWTGCPAGELNCCRCSLLLCFCGLFDYLW